MEHFQVERLLETLGEIAAELKKSNKLASIDNKPVKPPMPITRCNPDDAVVYNPSTDLYYVSVNIQDGHENCGAYAYRKEAVDAYITAQKVMNGVTLSEKEVPVYEVYFEQQPKMHFKRI